MACSDPEREKQPACTWLVYRIPFCNDAEVQHLFPPPPSPLGSRAGWSCLGDPEEALSPFCKVPDFGLMLVTVSVVVNLPSRAEREVAGGVGDPVLTQQVLVGLPPQAECFLTCCRAVPRVRLVLWRAGGLLPSLALSW